MMIVNRRAARAARSLRYVSICLVALTSSAWPSAARAELAAGMTAGAALAGNQDFVLNFFGPERTGIRRIEHDVPVSNGALAGLTLTDWPDAWRWFGAGVEGLFWNTPASMRQGRQIDVSQTRAAMLVSILGRYPSGAGIFVSGGLSGGWAYTTVRHGSDKLGPAVGASTGIAIPVTATLRLRAETQYLATHDADSARSRSSRVDTSGSARGNPARAIFGPHLDTQFLPLRVGLEWVFR
jgi:hypothetical protein